MNISEFYITGFINALWIKDIKGKKINFENRYASCFIVTLKGEIKFSYEGGCVVADRYHSVFLPQGLTYTNECTEDAESFVFNFFTQELYNKPEELSAVSEISAKKFFENIQKAASSDTAQSQLLILSELYSLSYRLFSFPNKKTTVDELLSAAAEFMMANYHNPELTIKDIANNCYISEIYLRKLFQKKYNTTPFKMLTDIRMKKAYELIMEKRPVKETAMQTGYSDIFQFSRAYKKYFGHPPSQT